MAPRVAADNSNDGRRNSNSRVTLDNLPLIEELQLLDIPAAARVLGCSRSKIYLMLTQDELESVKIGRLRKIPISEIRRITSTRHRIHRIEDAELERVITANRRPRRRRSQPEVPDR